MVLNYKNPVTCYRWSEKKTLFIGKQICLSYPSHITSILLYLLHLNLWSIIINSRNFSIYYWFFSLYIDGVFWTLWWLLFILLWTFITLCSYNIDGVYVIIIGFYIIKNMNMMAITKETETWIKKKIIKNKKIKEKNICYRTLLGT